MTTVAFLGTGLMGTGFIQRARANGLTVRAWNRSAAKAQALTANDAAGATACASVAEAVRGAERIHLSLADDVSVDAVLEPVAGALGRARRALQANRSPNAPNVRGHITQKANCF